MAGIWWRNSKRDLRAKRAAERSRRSPMRRSVWLLGPSNLLSSSGLSLHGAGLDFRSHWPRDSSRRVGSLIVDVDPASWALEPLAARKFLRHSPGPVSAVIPVSPFGDPIDFAAWRLFRDETGLAVVIDAAAMFDTIRAESVPAVISLHATKVLGVGEGGFVIGTDTSLIQELQKRANFGFRDSREATVRSFNGKMSEYAAAVGLAALDAGMRVAPILSGSLRPMSAPFPANPKRGSRRDSASVGSVRPWLSPSRKQAPKRSIANWPPIGSALAAGGEAACIVMRRLKNSRTG